MELKKIINQGIKTETEKKKKLSFLAGCVVGDELYFSSWIDRGFYKIDLQTGRCVPLGIFGKELESMCLYSQAVYFENTVWLIPAYGQNIVKVDLETLKMEYLDLPQEGKEILGKNGIRYGKFKCCYKEGTSEFWLAPLGYNMFLKVDMRTNQITEYSELKKKMVFENGYNNFSDACLVEDKVWFCPRDGEKLVIFDTQTDEFEFHEWKYVKENYRTIRNYKNQAVFLPQTITHNILLISQNTYEERNIPVDIEWEDTADFMYLVADVIGQQLFLAPYQAHECVAIDLESGRIQTDTNFHKYAEDMSWGFHQYQNSIRYGTKMIYTSDSKDVPLMILDIEKNMVSYLEKTVEWDVYRNFLINLIEKDKNDFLKYVNLEKETILEEELPLSIYCSKQSLLFDRKINNMHRGKVIGEKILLSVE